MRCGGNLCVFPEVVQEVVRGKGDGTLGGAGWRGEIICENCVDGTWVNADVSMMERVLQNLVVNAVAYKWDGGRVVISLERSGGELVFRIANEGEPLPDDILRWFNGSEGVRPKKAAIGLSIVKRVLGMHGFAFGAEVREGANVFWFRMPVAGSLDRRMTMMG